MSNKHSLKVGDSVLVKPGVMDSDTGIDLSHWQGRVIGINETEEYGIVVDIAWDSITLQNMPASFIVDCQRGGFQWSQYYDAALPSWALMISSPLNHAIRNRMSARFDKS